jgi:hypothetical protein
LVLLPAPDPQFGWDMGAYRYAWSEELGTYVRRHAVQAGLVVAKSQSVSEQENVSLLVAEGWRD